MTSEHTLIGSPLWEFELVSNIGLIKDGSEHL